MNWEFVKSSNVFQFLLFEHECTDKSEVNSRYIGTTIFKQTNESLMQSLENFATCSAQNMKDANCTYKKPSLPYFDDFETISTEFDLACDNRYVSRLGLSSF